MHRTKKEISRQKKKLWMKAFVEPKLMKRGSLKEITFSSGSPVP